MSLLSQNNEGKADDIDNQFLRMFYVATNQCAQLTESSQFENFITAVILLAGIMVGIGTYPQTNYEECVSFVGTTRQYDCTFSFVLNLIDTVILVSSRTLILPASFLSKFARSPHNLPTQSHSTPFQRPSSPLKSWSR